MTIPITNAELELMQVLWDNSPLTAREITAQLNSRKEWHRKTVNTLLSRLEKKGALRVDTPDEGARRFAPAIEQKEYARSATSEFVDQVFGGDLAPLVASFADGRSLDANQIEEIQDLLDSLRDDG